MKPIIMSTEMVKAILDGRKTQTRRPIKPQPIFQDFGYYGCCWKIGNNCAHKLSALTNQNPYGKVGNILWVRETWGTTVKFGSYKPSALPPNSTIYYRTNGEGQSGLDQWRPCIFMPKWAARLFLEIKSVRIERLQDISEEDIYAEGITEVVRKEIFAEFWDKLNKKRGFGWKTNPWVFVIAFERKEQQCQK